jgi:hypothetical protein
MRIVIGFHAGGLGDNLIYTTLPRLFSEQGDSVFISIRTPWRNDEIRQLCWERNPYVKGFVDEAPNAGNVFVDLKYIKSAKMFGPIKAMERCHGLKTDLPLILRRPEVYYRPRIREDLEDTVIIDPRSISQAIDNTAFEEFVNWVMRWNDFNRRKMFVVESKHSGPSGAGVFSHLPRLRVDSIFEYADVIAGAHAVCMAESGGHVLAAALRGKRTFAQFSTMAYNDRIFVFPNVQYYITGKTTPDFHYYPEG